MESGYFWMLSALLQAFAALTGLIGVTAAVYSERLYDMRRRNVEEEHLKPAVNWLHHQFQRTIYPVVVVVILCMVLLPWGKHLPQGIRTAVIVGMTAIAIYALVKAMGLLAWLWKKS